jgi:hypothetical protein
MKKIFTILSLVVATASFAQSPVINGIYSPTEGWGPVRGTGTQAGASNGWSGTDAIALYTTNDASYYYFGAQCKAASWMQFMFVVNTKLGGDSIDPWGRTVKYKHTNLPDYIFRGDIAGSNYAQFQGWNGTVWQRWDPGTSAYQAADINANASGLEVKGIFNSNDSGFIEIRVPKAAISGTPSVLDVQFIIGGNSGGTANGHGIFDAIPNQTNATSWSDPGNATIANAYITSIPLPISLKNFNGTLKNGAVALQWTTSNDLNANGFEVEKQEGSSWKNLGFVSALNNANGSTYTFNDVNLATTNVYRIKTISKLGDFKYSQIVVINGRTATATQVFPTLIKGGNINIRTNELVDGKANVRVLDIAGKIVKQASLNVTKGDVTQAFALPSLQSGMYMVEVKTASNTTNVKIMVN